MKGLEDEGIGRWKIVKVWLLGFLNKSCFMMNLKFWLIRKICIEEVEIISVFG